MKLTYDELEKMVKEQWEGMPKDERFLRLKGNDPTFEQFVLTHVPPGKSVILDYGAFDFTIVD